MTPLSTLLKRNTILFVAALAGIAVSFSYLLTGAALFVLAALLQNALFLDN